MFFPIFVYHETISCCVWESLRHFISFLTVHGSGEEFGYGSRPNTARILVAGTMLSYQRCRNYMCSYEVGLIQLSSVFLSTQLFLFFLLSVIILGFCVPIKANVFKSLIWILLDAAC